MTSPAASELYYLSSALRSVTSAIVPRVDDARPSEHLAGLALAAEHLASLLADKTWQLVELFEDAEFPTDQPDAITRETVGTVELSIRLTPGEADMLRRAAGDGDAAELLGDIVRARLVEIAGGADR